MAKYIKCNKYRKDIEGLRAIAVLAVIVFHLGYLPNGYLGVDVFFVISGYLITKIIFQQSLENRFSIIDFYIRRTRRIIPLVSFVGLVSLGIGILTMLPDDLENLAQSVIATNFFSNNILQVMTTKNYWDVVNEFKPLMHTWSLAIEEQYYLLYPIIFLIFTKKRIKWILPILSVITVVSIIAYLLPFREYYKFYLLPFRFFELSIGGIAAIVLKQNLIKHRYSPVLIGILIFFLFVNVDIVSSSVLIPATVIVTSLLLISANSQNKLTSGLLENKLMVGLGKISFSLYMWHQVVLAYTRYFVVEEMTIFNIFVVLLLILILSIMTFYFVEQIFRNKNIVKTPTLLWSVGAVTILTTSVSLYIYFNAGVLKDIPELDIKKTNVERNLHATYNANIYSFDREFHSGNGVKVLIIGNSFARDWANVLLESKYKNNIDISYIFDVSSHVGLNDRAEKANIIFVSEARKSIIKKYHLDEDKVWCIGTKSFGVSNGIHYNYRGANYYAQRTKMEKKVLKKNNFLKNEWGDKYIDIIGMVIDKSLMVPVFTPNHKFISQDCRHLTKSGAIYFAHIIENNPRKWGLTPYRE